MLDNQYFFQYLLLYGENIMAYVGLEMNGINPASILRKSTSGYHRPVSYPDGPMTVRYRFT